MSDASLHANFRGATVERIVRGEGHARIDCALRSGERIAIHLEGVMLIRMQNEDARTLVGAIEIGHGHKVRDLAHKAFAPEGCRDQPWLKGVARRALLGQLCYFGLQPRLGAEIACLCERVAILSACESQRTEAAA